MVVHTFELQSIAGDAAIDGTVGSDIGEVANPAQQAIGNPRRAARAAGDFRRPRFIKLST
jgi:hypothetical protein